MVTSKKECIECSNRHIFIKLAYMLIFGCKKDDGSYYWTRWHALQWGWNSTIKKWLKSPLHCKFRIHRLEMSNDVGLLLVKTTGYLDVWCLDCDMMISIPIDDLSRRLKEKFLKLKEVLGKGE